MLGVKLVLFPQCISFYTQLLLPIDLLTIYHIYTVYLSIRSDLLTFFQYLTRSTPWFPHGFPGASKTSSFFTSGGVSPGNSQPSPAFTKPWPRSCLAWTSWRKTPEDQARPQPTESTERRAVMFLNGAFGGKWVGKYEEDIEIWNMYSKLG